MHGFVFTARAGFILLACAVQPLVAAQSLDSFYWRAVSINGEQLDLQSDQIPHIAFHQESSRIAGFGGCNRFFALYEEQGSALTITVMGGGRSQCPDLDNLEQNFLGVLQGTQTYQLDGNKLYLMLEDKLLGEFVGVDP